MPDGLSFGEIGALAAAFPEPGAARAVLVAAGIPIERLPWNVENAATFWGEVSANLSHGILIGGRVRVLTAARRMLPDDHALAQGRTPDDSPLGPVAWDVPRAVGRFVGRADAVTRLDAALSGSSLVAVTGMAGIGKSRLAVEYAQRHRGDLDVVWWVGESGGELIDERVRDLAGHVDLAGPVERSGLARPECVLQQLDASGTRWLLVLDHAADPAALPEWLMSTLASSESGRVLVTSRNPYWAGAGLDGRGVAVAVGPLDRAESVALLTDRLPAVDWAAAERIAAALEDHPLALEQAANRMGRGRLPAESYLAALVERPTVVLGQGEAPGRAGVTVAKLWNESIHDLNAESPPAGELLRLTAHGAGGTPLPLRLLAADPQAIPDARLRAAASDDLELADVVANLERSGLAHADGDGWAVTMPSLVREFVRATADDAQNAELTDALGRMLHACLPERVTANPPAWMAWRELLPHARAVLDATPPSADTPHTAWLAEHTAAYLTEQGHADAAEPLAARAVTAHERLDGPDHPDTLTARETHIRAALSLDAPPFMAVCWGP